jgi:LCP family protein required for cell wall assembly
VTPTTAPRVFLHRYLVALGLSFAMAAGGIGGAYWLANAKLDGAPRARVDLDEQDPGEAANYLIIGSDTRSFVDDPTDAEHFGDEAAAGGQRSDTIMIAHVDPETKTGLLVSLPRDLWVEIPGVGGSKINAAFNAGPQRVIDTIKENFDVEIHHYLEVNFEGFRNIVDAIGDVPIYFPAPARDVYTGLLVEEAGCHELDGEEALQYVRSRFYEYRDADGEWKDDPSSDLGRIRRQQYFIRSTAREAVNASLRNFTRVNNILNKFKENVTVDADLSLGDLRALANTFREVDPAVVEMVTMPAEPERIDGESALRLVEAEAEPILRRLRSFGPARAPEPPGDVAPADVRVVVHNGSGVEGQARAALDALAALGFGAVEPPGNADRSDYEVTEVRYAPGAERAARLVLAYLGGAGELVALDDAPAGADVDVVVGRDFDGVVAPTTTAPTGSAPGPTATTTTGPPANPGGDGALPSAGC